MARKLYVRYFFPHFISESHSNLKFVLECFTDLRNFLIKNFFLFQSGNNYFCIYFYMIFGIFIFNYCYHVNLYWIILNPCFIIFFNTIKYSYNSNRNFYFFDIFWYYTTWYQFKIPNLYWGLIAILYITFLPKLYFVIIYFLFNNCFLCTNNL